MISIFPALGGGTNVGEVEKIIAALCAINLGARRWEKKKKRRVS